MIYLEEFYNENNVRTKRRNKIIDNSIPFVISKGINNVTFTDIAEFLQVERKTIYRYYDSKEDLLVDVGFLLVYEINQLYQSVIDKVIENNEKLGSINSINYAFSLITIEIQKNPEKYIFINDFDVFLYNLDSNSKPYLRYQSMITNFKTKNHYMEELIKIAYINNEINSNLEVAVVTEILEQSFHAYLTRTLIKKEESSRYKLENIETFIDLLIKGLVSG